ncbi:hypothetical protein ACI798_01390 [Geodermatophilus sp. SYSU D01045]
MFEIRNPLSFSATLFAGAEDNRWTLPASLVEARDAVVRLGGLAAQAWDQAPEQPHAIRDRVAAQIAAGADVDLGPIHTAQQAVTDHDERMALIRRAQEIAGNRLAGELHDQAGSVIADHLQPVLAELVDQLKRDFAAIAHIPADAPLSVVLTQPKPVREAAIRIDTAVAEYDTLRAAYSLARKLGTQRETDDGYGFFFEIRNTEQVWPGITGLFAVTPSDIPWPTTSTRDRLAWFFAHEAQPWMPTAQEQDHRWHEVFGERVRQAAANRSHLEAYRHMFDDARPARPTAEADA